MRILVAEDDAQTAAFITKGLREHGHVADHAADGHEALMLGAQGGYDVLVLDRMLPGLDGLSLLKSLRAAGNHSPAIFLTALGSIDERVAGLEVAEDYLVKPFAFAELYARIGSLARRPAAKQEQTLLECGELSMDLLRRKVMRGQREISLQPTEFRLLEFLMRHAGQVVTRTMLLESVWEFHFDPKTNIVETHISRLRAKLNQDEEADVLRTVRGAGYVLDDTHSA
jgi:two-component system OmpR family response regulator